MNKMAVIQEVLLPSYTAANDAWYVITSVNWMLPQKLLMAKALRLYNIMLLCQHQ